MSSSRPRRAGTLIAVSATAALAAIVVRDRVSAAGSRAAAGAEPEGAPAARYRDTLPWRLYNGASALLDRWVGWDRLPTPLGLAVLVGVRNVLRQRNLHDTGGLPDLDPAGPDREWLTARTPDGSRNDPDVPSMGMANTRFGRNVPIAATHREPEAAMLTPSPREVSLDLMTRRRFVPATSVNVLATAWIQFMVKDWFSHGQGDPAQRWEVPLADGDPWPERPMTILKTVADPSRPAGGTAPPTYLNTETHWWDGSSIYGTGAPGDEQRRTGRDGKLVIGDDGRLRLPADPARNPATVPGWWLGLNLMTTAFIREHNAICDALKAEYPGWNDDELYRRARLINAALTARIHTVEWTPAIIAHPTTVLALRANWWGLAGEKLHKLVGRISDSEVISGIPGTRTDHYGVPFTLTEEFSIVYRMHPLVPDDYALRAAADGRLLRTATFPELAGPHAQAVTDEVAMADLFYSFGTAYPGAIVLHNFPRFLQEFRRPDGKLMDLAAHDILRTRELGVPRYNEFRRLLHLRPARTFAELAGDPEVAAELHRVYRGDIERVDTITGMFAEKRPRGFAFSDTAFRIFVLMASRRLNSDRFLTRDFTPHVYTPLGMAWVQNTTMVDVLLRHYPELRPALRGVTNAFQPWPDTPAA
ncbi:peroxidase [Virgisporangium aliadipatigenens]|uniref:Peroxidase n=1 Tax=Virgisporangium aliadipatigenens TaxID=741659 RepID=A0A8J4DP31_9ACTN|nr:peroxidase family protein [Virgisporangium aliadipatigenens]GIJ44067.1 peroxidase [Virgisporangium aliadipatigenens]